MGELVITEPKTKNSVRRVALYQKVVNILVRENKQHPDSPILFPLPCIGGYWSWGAVPRINRKLSAKGGIEEHVRFHELRHPMSSTRQKYNSEKQKTQATKMDLIA